MVDDFWFHYVTDIGLAGPDRGQGGKYSFVPPDYDGDLPADDFHVFRSATFNNLLGLRGFLKDVDPAPAATSIRHELRIYPYGLDEDKREPMNFVAASGLS
jgi:hypothetical protein